MSHLHFTVGRTYAIPILHTMIFVWMKERHRMSFADDVEPMLEHRVARSNQSTEKDEGPNEDGWIKRKSKRDIVVEGC